MCATLRKTDWCNISIFSADKHDFFFLAGGFAVVLGQPTLHMDVRTPVTQEYIYSNSKLINSLKSPRGFQ